MRGRQTGAVDQSERMRREVEEVRAAMNARAAEFARLLLPNGRKAGRYWETSNINDDRTGSYSLKVNLDGTRQGCWTDFGLANGAPGAHGDILSLYVEREHGGDFAAAIAQAKRMLNMEGMSDADFARSRAESERRRAEAEAREAEDMARRRTRAEGLWRGARPMVDDGRPTPAYHYLAGRGIALQKLGRMPGALRYCPDAWCDELARKHGRGFAKLPAMVACILALDGSIMGAHRTYLDVSAGKYEAVTKAKLDEPKLSLGPSLGGHIPLWKGRHRHSLKDIPAGTDVYMSEGIEDGLSVAMARPELRIIAGVSLSKMGAVALPPQIGRLVIIGQNDTKEEAIEALENAIAAQQARGYRVDTIFPPDRRFKDFNDMLCGKVRDDA